MTIIFLHLPTLLPHSMTVHCANLEGKKSWVFHDTSVVESLRKKHKIKDPRSAPSKPPGNVKDNQSNAPAQNRLTGNKRIYPPSTPVRLEKNQAPRNDQRICLGSPLPSKIKATKCKLHPIWKRKIIQLLQCKTLTRKKVDQQVGSDNDDDNGDMMTITELSLFPPITALLW